LYQWIVAKMVGTAQMRLCPPYAAKPSLSVCARAE
jgi:hypothetical protein